MDWGVFATAMVALVVGVLSLARAERTEALRSKGEQATVAFQAEVRSKERAESRRIDLEARLAAQREPLIEAARDLEQRLGNIRHKAFLEFYGHDSAGRRAELAALSTLYRLGKYLATVEAMRTGVDTWTLETDERTAGVAAALDKVAWTLATDSWSGLMLWREEQRAIGELMLSRSDQRSIGFAEFCGRYDSDFRPWLADFREELLRAGTPSSPRLAALQDELGTLRAVLESGRPPEPRSAPGGRLTPG